MLSPSRCLLLCLAVACLPVPSITVRQATAAEAISILPADITLRGAESSHGILVQRSLGDDIGEQLTTDVVLKSSRCQSFPWHTGTARSAKPWEQKPSQNNQPSYDCSRSHRVCAHCYCLLEIFSFEALSLEHDVGEEAMRCLLLCSR